MMDIALANILFRACGRDPSPNGKLSDQGVGVSQAEFISQEIHIEYSVTIKAADILEWTPNEIQHYIRTS